MKITNEQMSQLIWFLDRCEDIKVASIPDRKSKMTVITCTQVLYTLNTKLKKKRRDYLHKPHFTLNLKLMEQSSLWLLYMAIGSNCEFVQSLVSEIDKVI